MYIKSACFPASSTALAKVGHAGDDYRLKRLHQDYIETPPLHYRITPMSTALIVGYNVAPKSSYCGYLRARGKHPAEILIQVHLLVGELRIF